MDELFEPCFPWESIGCPPLAFLIDMSIEQVFLLEMEEQADLFYESLACN